MYCIVYTTVYTLQYFAANTNIEGNYNNKKERETLRTVQYITLHGWMLVWLIQYY